MSNNKDAAIKSSAALIEVVEILFKSLSDGNAQASGLPLEGISVILANAKKTLKDALEIAPTMTPAVSDSTTPRFQAIGAPKAVRDIFAPVEEAN